MRRNGSREAMRRSAGGALIALIALCVIAANGRAALAAPSGSLASASAPALSEEARVELERILSTRGFTRGLPAKPMPTPDGRRVFFLRSGATDRIQSLYVYDVAKRATQLFMTADGLGGSDAISKEEQARRERQRETERGITGFSLSDDGKTVLIPHAGDLFLADAATGASRGLTATPDAEIDAHLSPDGAHVAFVRGGGLVVLEIATGRETVVARSTEAGVEYGVAEHVAQEEMDRTTGHWWSPDSRRIAFTEVDTRGVPLFRVPDFSDPTSEGSVSPYPKAGDPNAIVRLGVATIARAPSDVEKDARARVGAWERGGAAATAAAEGVTWLDIGADTEYLARVDWSPDSRALWVQTQPRSQKRLDLRRIDLESRMSDVVLSEEDPDWVNLHDAFFVLKRGDRFLWASERSGHRHLEIVGADGVRERALTSGEWDVMRVVHVDESNRDVTFIGTMEGVLERHVYRVSLSGGAVRKLSTEPGWHDAHFNARCHGVFVETWENETTPPKYRVRRRGGSLEGELPSEAAIPDAAEIAPESQLIHTTTPVGVTLDMRVTAPEGRLPGDKRPLIVYVYGGPGAQQVARKWPGERGLVDAWLARRGFIVARIDGRGVAGRGHDSERIYSLRMGEEELQDQVAGVHALMRALPEIDASRVGIWGWSYGGYMTLMAMMRAHDTFAAGVSIAPVVDWRGYDTHYTERYLGLPSENAAGYDSSSILTCADDLEGHLTLVHGTGDDNVHFRESMILVNRLVESGKDFRLMVYPGTHMMETLAERMHIYTLVWRTFVEQFGRAPEAQPGAD
ncbi:MAG: S9 family peptidase [bacterium]